MIIPGIMAGHSRRGSGLPATSLVWNSADKDGGITLSNGDLTATAAAAFLMVRGTIGKSTGKWYFEVTCTASLTFGTVGIAEAGASLSSFVGGQTSSFGIATSLIYTNFTSTGSDVGISAGDVVGVAVDLDAGKVWFAGNNVWVNGGNPAAGTSENYSGLSGTYYPADSPSTTSHTINAALVYAPPAGFSVWT